MPHAMRVTCVFLPTRNSLRKYKMALQAYLPSLQCYGYIAQQRCRCGKGLSPPLQEKKRKRKASKTRMLKRRMIRLVEELLIQRYEIHRKYGSLLRYTWDYQKRLFIIRKVPVQEKKVFEGHKVSNRIVCIERHYVRPIVRGKGNQNRRVRYKDQ